MRKMLVVLGILLPAAALSAAPRSIIVDTDAGSDDIMAISFLLLRQEVQIEAITVVNGIAHVHEGARNILRLLEAAGRTDIPVYIGHDVPLKGTNAFPESWRLTADALPGVNLPEATRKPEAEGAVEFLAKRLRMTNRPFSILALGPLTNLADALSRVPGGAYPVEDMVIMGGAVRVKGNLLRSAVLKENDTAEWNIYIDPSAARTVLQSALRFRLVPLDACNKVPIDRAFLEEFKKGAKTPLARIVADLLESSRTLIRANIFYAWDPLAAVALINPAVLKISSVPIGIIEEIPDIGRTVEASSGHSPVRVALDAEPASFHRTFLDTFGIGPASVRTRPATGK